jgi:membrane protein YqaA with SNARE-associated domain
LQGKRLHFASLSRDEKPKPVENVEQNPGIRSWILRNLPQGVAHGLTNVILGRFFPLRKTSRWQEKAVGWLKRYGAATLLLSWMPVIGDLLCLLAGWMRISWGPVLVFLCLGKALRYVLVAIATLQGMTWWH